MTLTATKSYMNVTLKPTRKSLFKNFSSVIRMLRILWFVPAITCDCDDCTNENEKVGGNVRNTTAMIFAAIKEEYTNNRKYYTGQNPEINLQSFVNF